MKTITKSIDVVVQDNEKQAIAWLEKQYPRGIALVYTDYRDRFEDMGTVQEIIKGTFEDDYAFLGDAQADSVQCVLKEYMESGSGPAFTLSDEVEESMRSWLYDHDTSDPLKDMLKNTGRKLFYLETEDTTGAYGNMEKQVADLQKKYGQTDAQKKEISYVLNEQFYGAPVSFYFYASVSEVYNALYGSEKEKKYIEVTGAYFSTVDRVQGSNWLGNEAIFNIAIPRQFFDSVFLDEAKGTGYGWGEIAGQTGYSEATVSAVNTLPIGTLLIMPTVSEAQQRETRLQAHWDKTGTCTRGDMNWKRHKGDKPYKDEFPCGNTCETCGTFWVD